jgi:SPP1 family predicted phage head-tail adaptor
MPIKARIGEMRKRIEIKDKGTPTRDAAGAEVITWTTLYTVWAKVVPYSAREMMQSGREFAERFTRFAIRYRSGIYPTQRVEFDSRTYEITSVINVDERNEEILLICKEEIDD